MPTWQAHSTSSGQQKQEKKSLPLKHLVEAEAHWLCLPPLPALHPSLPGTEGKQRTPEIASLPAVRQEATIPMTERSHAIDTESWRCPAIHFWGPGRGGWQGSTRVHSLETSQGRQGSVLEQGASLYHQNPPPWLCHPRHRDSAGLTPYAAESTDISGAIKYAWDPRRKKERVLILKYEKETVRSKLLIISKARFQSSFNIIFCFELFICTGV